MSYHTLQVRFQEPICFLQLDRPEADNAINERLIEECRQVLALCEESITVVVLEGLPEVFCFGADFQGIHAHMASGQQWEQDPEPLYDLWLKMATGPYITVSHVRGKANAGGVGFVAASDIVLADQTAQFSLSELLFGLFPACVLPFLIRRIGFQKAHYLTLMTKPISVQQAHAWGLVDAYEAQSESLLRKHLLRLRRLSKIGIMRYKRYMNGLHDSLLHSKSLAVAANKEIFSEPRTLQGIFRYVETGQFPWEE
ncbi:MAG: enoyl-CoA hydratase/isomerase [Gammaproteobacteria bacterium]|nr:enoyl-CoA hydratase/isomerase [Gammaproteobacteria bacterium]